MATRTPLDSLCLLHAYAGVCVYEYVFVCVLACWKPQQSQCTPHPHTHSHTCCVIPVHKYLHMKFIMLKISQDLKARDRERVKREWKREREGGASENKAKLGDPGGVCIMNSNPQPAGNKCHDNLPSPSSPAHLATACRRRHIIHVHTSLSTPSVSLFMWHGKRRCRRRYRSRSHCRRLPCNLNPFVRPEVGHICTQVPIPVPGQDKASCL